LGIFAIIAFQTKPYSSARTRKKGNQEQSTNNEGKSKKTNAISKERHLSRIPARGLVTLLGKKLRDLWRMSVHLDKMCAKCTF